jgi:hypothetical protein
MIQNSPKIYFIKNQEGKFYNAKNQYYSSAIINANFERNDSIVKSLLKLDKFKDCEIHCITEHEFMEEMANKTTTAVLAGEYFHRVLSDIDNHLPTISQVNKTMSQKTRVSIDVLKPFDLMHKDFISKKEEDTDDVQGRYKEFINEMCKVQIYQTAEVTAILKAYFKDKGSILGVTKKILR